MKFSYNWLKEYVPKIGAPQKLAADLTMGIFEVEDVEQFGKDWVLDIKVLPNRSHDCLAHLGIAREAAAIENLEFSEPKIELKEDKSLKIKDFLDVEVKEKKLCPRYSARVVIDVKVGDSPLWLQERLKVCGLRPINNIVDITNYVMLECGQPLHAFDLDKIDQQKIIVRLATKGEKIITLDEGRAERILNENILVIADPKGAIGIAGIKGGRGPEIDSKTKRIALEAAKFEPINIRKSSKALNLRTDASWRFENDPDINITIWALERAASLINKLAGGTAVSGVIDVAAKNVQPWDAAVAHDYIESLLGVKIKPEQVLQIFKRLDLPVKQSKKSVKLFYELKVPTRRSDLLTQEDLIEEIGRLFGYQNICAKMPSGEMIPALENEQVLYLDEVRDILVGLGYSEVYNYSLISENDKKLYEFKDLSEVSNPLSREQKYFRPNLALGLVKNLEINAKHFLAGSIGQSGNALRLFEEGHVFEKSDKKIFERKDIAGLVYLPKNKRAGFAFYELKGAVEIIFGKLGLAGLWDDDYLPEGLPINLKFIFDPSRSAQIKVGNDLLGFVGELNPSTASRLDIEGQAAMFEVDFEKLIDLVDEERIYQPPSKYPAVTRDLAILVEANTKVEIVMNEIENAAGQLLAGVDLFDIYEGEDLANEIKSLAFHLIWQSSERNLSDLEINKLMEKIIKVLGEKGWEVRK